MTRKRITNRNIKKVFKKASLLILITFATSCSDSEKGEFYNYKWSSAGGNVVIENGFYHTYTSFDASKKQMQGDTLIPIQKLDSTVLVTQRMGLGKLTEDYKRVLNRDSVRIDTFRYDIRDFNGIKLILFKEIAKDMYYSEVFKLEDEVELTENKTFVQPTFEIAGYTIGDTISRENVRLKDVYTFGDHKFEVVELRGNTDVEMELLGGKYISSITQKNINDRDLKDIINVVNHKMQAEPEYSPIVQRGEYLSDSYSWDKASVKILLIGMVYKGSSPYGQKSKDWTLVYEDYIKERLLKLDFSNSTPTSAIIE